MNSLGLSLSSLVLLASYTLVHADGMVQGRVTLDKPKPPAVGPGYKPETQKPVQNEEAPRALVYLENGNGMYPKRAGEILSIRQQGYQFRPSFAVIQTGGAAEFPNQDDEFHNVFSYSRVRRFDLGRFRKDEASPRIDFDKPGLVKIYCEIHQHMRCLVLVVDTPWHTTTDPEGAFTLPKVPSGDYTLKALLPSEKTLMQKITVRDGAVTKVALTR